MGSTAPILVLATDGYWGQVEALATAASALVLALAATFALLQVYALRQSDQLRTLLQLSERLHDSVLRHAGAAPLKIKNEIADPAFRSELIAETGRAGELRRDLQPLLSEWEAMGLLVKHKLIDEDVFMDMYSLRVIATWEHLAPCIAITRRQLGPSAFENFEDLVVRAKCWLIYDGSRHRIETRRLELVDEYLTADELAKG